MKVTIGECIEACEMGDEVRVNDGKTVIVQLHEIDLKKFQRGIQKTFAKAMLFEKEMR